MRSPSRRPQEAGQGPPDPPSGGSPGETGCGRGGAGRAGSANTEEAPCLTELGSPLPHSLLPTGGGEAREQEGRGGAKLTLALDLEKDLGQSFLAVVFSFAIHLPLRSLSSCKSQNHFGPGRPRCRRTCRRHGGAGDSASSVRAQGARPLGLRA